MSLASRRSRRGNSEGGILAALGGNAENQTTKERRPLSKPGLFSTTASSKGSCSPSIPLKPVESSSRQQDDGDESLPATPTAKSPLFDRSLPLSPIPKPLFDEVSSMEDIEVSQDDETEEDSEDDEEEEEEEHDDDDDDDDEYQISDNDDDDELEADSDEDVRRYHNKSIGIVAEVLNQTHLDDDDDNVVVATIVQEDRNDYDEDDTEEEDDEDPRDEACHEEDHSSVLLVGGADQDVDAKASLAHNTSQLNPTATTVPDTDKENEPQTIDKSKNDVHVTKTKTRSHWVRKGKWSMGSRIGTGSFGVVHVGMNTHTGHLMAIKTVHLQSTQATRDVKTEVQLLSTLRHPNIVRYLGAERDRDALHIFQEWVPGGSVTTLLQKFGPFCAPVLRSYLTQLLHGLAYLHDHSILHRDIKGGNVLISNDGIVKLADFGAAKRIQSLHAMQTLTMRGTPYFMAPEVFEEKYNSKADIWSVACVALQMATGMPPWKTFSNPTTLYLHLHNSEGLPPLEWPDNCTMEDKQEFVDMLQRCFWRNPDQRPTAHGLLSDPFLTHSSSEEEEPSSPCSELFSPVSTVTRSSTPPFQSPPLPRRIIKLNYTPQQQVVSPLHNHSPPVLDSREWPSWARQQVTKAKMVDDSLALSASPNPFARTLSSPLKGLQYVP